MMTKTRKHNILKSGPFSKIKKMSEFSQDYRILCYDRVLLHDITSLCTERSEKVKAKS